jgi:hypothetical protein
LVLGALVVAGGVVAVVLLTGDDDQSSVAVHRGDALPDLRRLNHADDYGADVVRAYLTAALACSPGGERLMIRLSRTGESGARMLLLDACRRTGGRPFADRLEAKISQEDLDLRGRSLWRVTDSGGKLPDDLILRVRQASAGWEIDRACRGTCPR